MCCEIGLSWNALTKDILRMSFHAPTCCGQPYAGKSGFPVMQALVSSSMRSGFDHIQPPLAGRSLAGTNVTCYRRSFHAGGAGNARQVIIFKSSSKTAKSQGPIRH